MKPKRSPPQDLYAVRPALVAGHSPSAGHVICTNAHTQHQHLPHSLVSAMPHVPSALHTRRIDPLTPAPQLSTRVVATFVSGHTPSSGHVGIGTTPHSTAARLPQCVTSTLVHTPFLLQSPDIVPSKCSPQLMSTCSRLPVTGNPLTAGQKMRSAPQPTPPTPTTVARVHLVPHAVLLTVAVLVAAVAVRAVLAQRHAHGRRGPAAVAAAALLVALREVDVQPLARVAARAVALAELAVATRSGNHQSRQRAIPHALLLAVHLSYASPHRSAPTALRRVRHAPHARQVAVARDEARLALRARDQRRRVRGRLAPDRLLGARQALYPSAACPASTALVLRLRPVTAQHAQTRYLSVVASGAGEGHHVALVRRRPALVRLAHLLRHYG